MTTQALLFERGELPPARHRQQIEQPIPWCEFDQVLVALSGGKDSIACLLTAQANHAHVIAIHHHIDGHLDDHRPLMDWPCTGAYVRALCSALDAPLIESWRAGGFEAEMLRDNSPTGDVRFILPDGSHHRVAAGPRETTRLNFPQIGDIRSGRWCSPKLKIDVAATVIAHTAFFQGTKTLFLTGERAEESHRRATYNFMEPHRSATRSRFVTHCRPVLHQTEAEIWDIIRLAGIRLHPAYYLGWSRLSCMACIFGSPDQWASIAQIAPDILAKLTNHETTFARTLHRDRTIPQTVALGRPYPDMDQILVAQALASSWDQPILISPMDWVHPKGAFTASFGPT